MLTRASAASVARADVSPCAPSSIKPCERMIIDFGPSTSRRFLSSAANPDTDCDVSWRICVAFVNASCSTSRSQGDIVLGSVSPHARNSSRWVTIGFERFSKVIASKSLMLYCENIGSSEPSTLVIAFRIRAWLVVKSTDGPGGGIVTSDNRSSGDTPATKRLSAATAPRIVCVSMLLRSTTSMMRRPGRRSVLFET